MYSPSFRIWGYETNYGSFAQFTKVQGQQCMPKPKHLTWEERGGLHAGRRHRLADAARLGRQRRQEGRRGPDLGRRGRPRLDGHPDRQGGRRDLPMAMVSGEDKFDYCMKLGAKGCINRNDFDHWGMLPHWKDNAGYAKWLKGVRSFGAKIWEVLGEKRAPNIVFEHPGETTIPASIFVCDTGGMVVVCAGTTGYNATVDLRYLWMRQKRLQGSHFANDVQANQMNELALSGRLDPCMSRAFTYEELPIAHQLMHDNQHPHGNMSVLIGAADFGLGASARSPVAMVHATLPKGDVHTTPAPYPMSTPLPGIAEGEPITIADDGTRVRDLMHRGIISCTLDHTVATVAKIMVDEEIHAVVVMDDQGRAVGVVSQTDMVLARQGRTPDQARSLRAAEIMTPGCATCDADC
jgi:crotonyl-CoA carboxylase/reductase